MNCASDSLRYLLYKVGSNGQLGKALLGRVDLEETSPAVLQQLIASKSLRNDDSTNPFRSSTNSNVVETAAASETSAIYPSRGKGGPSQLFEEDLARVKGSVFDALGRHAKFRGQLLRRPPFHFLKQQNGLKPRR